MPDDIITSQQLAGLQAGINAVFGNINSQLSSTGLSTQLPLLGSGSASITVAQLQAWQAQIYSDLSTLASTGMSSCCRKSRAPSTGRSRPPDLPPMRRSASTPTAMC
jgi:hypothetical protein